MAKKMVSSTVEKYDTNAAPTYRHKIDTLFPSVSCDAELFSRLIGMPISQGEFGYFLMKRFVVPYAFMDRLQKHLINKRFEYGAVLSVQEIVGNDFYESLDENERSVLGVCLLQLIELGAIPIDPGSYE